MRNSIVCILACFAFVASNGDAATRTLTESKKSTKWAETIKNKLSLNRLLPKKKPIDQSLQPDQGHNNQNTNTNKTADSAFRDFSIRHFDASKKNTLGWTQDTLDALDNASKNGWELRVLSNGPQSVVLAGETHIKGKKAYEAGENLIPHFDLYGSEGVELKKYWGKGVATSAVLRLIQGVLPSLGIGIHATAREGFIPLEKNHKPGLAEQISVAAIPTFLALNIMRFADVGGLGQLYASLPDEVRSAVIAYLAFNYALGSKVVEKYADKKWSYPAAPIAHGLLRGRNLTMTDNVHKVLEENPEASKMFVLIGKAHVDGMAGLLKKKGYREINPKEK